MDEKFNKPTPTATSSPMPIAQGQPSAQPSSGAGIALGLIAELLGDFAADIETLSLTKLRQKYSSESNSHMNMLARCKTHGALVHEKFLEFKSFLRLMGPVPAPGYTLDRLNSADPEYAPGKVRWASKKEQAVNKQNVILLTGANGVVRPLTEWAEVLKIPATTLKSRRAKGWTDAEVLYGKKSTITYAKAPAKYRAAAVFPWPADLRGDWEERYRRAHWREQWNTDDYGNTIWRHETRAAFLVRMMIATIAEITDKLERTVDPNLEPEELDADTKNLIDRLQRCNRIRAYARTLTGAAAGPWSFRDRAFTDPPSPRVQLAAPDPPPPEAPKTVYHPIPSPHPYPLTPAPPLPPPPPTISGDRLREEERAKFASEMAFARKLRSIDDNHRRSDATLKAFISYSYEYDEAFGCAPKTEYGEGDYAALVELYDAWPSKLVAFDAVRNTHERWDRLKVNLLMDYQLGPRACLAYSKLSLHDIWAAL